MMRRSVRVDWIPRGNPSSKRQTSREFGWEGVQEQVQETCEKLPFTRNEHGITEDAAIGIMAALIYELEHAVIQTVLQIGSGGDYLTASAYQTP